MNSVYQLKKEKKSDAREVNSNTLNRAAIKAYEKTMKEPPLSLELRPERIEIWRKEKEITHKYDIALEQMMDAENIIKDADEWGSQMEKNEQKHEMAKEEIIRQSKQVQEIISQITARPEEAFLSYDARAMKDTQKRLIDDARKNWNDEKNYYTKERPDQNKFKKTADRAAMITRIPKARDYSDYDYRSLSMLYCESTDEKHSVANFLKQKIFLNLANADRNDFALVVIGAGGDGRLAKKLAGRTTDSDTLIRQFFSEVHLINTEETEAIEVLREYFETKFYKVTKEDMQRFGGQGNPSDIYRPSEKIEGETLMRISQGHIREKMPLNYQIIPAKFPDDERSRQHMGDVVLLNYMLPYNPFGQWINIIESAYEQVKPGGILVIPMHELDSKDPKKSIGLFLNRIGGHTYNIDLFADKIEATLKPKKAEFTYHLIDGSSLVSTEHFAQMLVKFAALDCEPNLGKIEQHPDELKAFVDGQKTRLKIEGNGDIELYEIAQQSKIIIAHKPL